MKKTVYYLFFLSLLLLPPNVYALDKVPGLIGFGTDTRGAYANLDEFNGSVTFNNSLSQIQAAAIGAGLEAGNSVEVDGSTSNDGIYMISVVATDALTVTVAPANEGPTASVDVDQVPTIFMVDDLTYNDGSLSDGTRNGVPVKLGSLSNAIDADQNNKIIFFETSGHIPCDESPWLYSITNNGVEIYGQTAPSPGITLSNQKMRIRSSDIIIQHLRFRTGDAPGYNPDARDNLGITSAEGDTIDDVIIDHCSFSWGVDENLEVYENHVDSIITDITISNCLISEGLFDSIHSEGGHAKGMQLGGTTDASGPDRVAIIGNIFAHCFDRAPRMYRVGEVVIANNLTYNFQDTNVWMGDSYGTINITSNATVGSLDSGSNVENYYVRVWESGEGASLYTIGNRCGQYNYPTVPVIWNHEQTSAVDWGGVSLYGAANPTHETAENVSISGASYLSSSDLLTILPTTAGARPLDRDVVDVRVIADLADGSGRIIDTVYYQESDCVGVDDPIGACTGSGTWDGRRNAEEGWPTLTVNTITHNDIPSDPHGDDDSDGYTNLEEWIHLKDDIVGVLGSVFTQTEGNITESGIVDGGATIILTLSGTTLNAFDNTIRAAIVSGMDSAQSEATGWDALIKADPASWSETGVVRTDATTITITLPSAPYAITANETITITVPAVAVVSDNDIVASPNVLISNESESTPEIGVGVVYNTSGGSEVTYEATGGKAITSE